MSDQSFNRLVITHPTEVVADEQCNSADELSLVNSAIDCDSVVARDAASSSSSTGGDGDTRWKLDSLSVQFNPLINSKPTLVEAGDPVFKTPLLPGTGGDSGIIEGGLLTSSLLLNDHHGVSESDPQPPSPTPMTDNDPTLGFEGVGTDTLCSTSTSSLCITVLVREPPSCSINDNLNQTVILSMPTIILRDGCNRNDESPLTQKTTAHVSTADDIGVEPNSRPQTCTLAAASVKDIADPLYESFRESLVIIDTPRSCRDAEPSQAEQSISDKSFLEAFSKGVDRLYTPTKLEVVAQSYVQSPEAQVQGVDYHNLNGTFNVTPPRPPPPESLNVTQTLVHHNAAVDCKDPEKPLHHNTPPPPVNTTFVVEEEEDNQSGTASPTPTQSDIPRTPTTSVPPNLDVLGHIQKLKETKAQLDAEYEKECREAEEIIAMKQARLKTLTEECKVEEENCQKSYLELELAKQELRQVLEELRQTESKFASMNGEYENIKKVHSNIELNIETLNQRSFILAHVLGRKEQREQAAMQCVNNRLDVMKQDFESMVKEREVENMKLKARLRMVELTLEQKDARGKQLDLQNSKLRALCDDVLNHSKGAQ